jgi:hypothetical protein
VIQALGSEENEVINQRTPEMVSNDNKLKTYCMFCGSTVGQISDRTEERVTAVYDCPKCEMNYCDQCSYAKEVEGQVMQLCLRCDSRMEKVA